MNSVKTRVAWADVCKGVLIILLMFSHIVWVTKDFYGLENKTIDCLGTIGSIWNCFFMSCFFLVSGMFSNFSKPFKQFVWGNFKALIFPALVSLFLFNIYKFPNIDYTMVCSRALLYGGGFWFLCSLFLGKIVLWFIVKWEWRNWMVIVILLIASFFGKLLDHIDIFPNVWYHRNFLNFTLYIAIGFYFKDLILKKAVGLGSSIVFVFTIVVLYTSGIKIPNVVAIFNESLSQHPITILLSITGSITCIHMCKIIAHNPVLEYLGRNSLIVYIYHMTFLSFALAAIEGAFCQATIRNSIVLIFMAVVSTLVFCSMLSAMMNTKYFKWMKGAF